MSEAGGVTNFVRQYTPCLRRFWALLRLRIQKERVTDDEEEETYLPVISRLRLRFPARAKELNTLRYAPECAVMTSDIPGKAIRS